MTTLTLYEHQISGLLQLSEADIRALNRLNRTSKEPILRLLPIGSSYAIQATEHVGFVRFGRHAVQVLPKMYKQSSPPARQYREASMTLLWMLDYALGLSLREPAVETLLDSNLNWFEVLTRLFASHLLEEWQRGASQSYLTIEDDIPTLRGKWRLTEQARHPARGHIFSVAYDEFTSDNMLNRVFRYVVERLWHLTGDMHNQRLLDLARQWLDDVTLAPVMTSQDAEPGLITRLNERYEPLLNLARLFLAGGALHTEPGALPTFSLTFDMNVLFELFVATFLRARRAHILPPWLQDCEMLPQARGAALRLAQRDTIDVFTLKPDIVFRREGPEYPLLLDTKYKLLDENQRKLGVSESDFYQMYAYARRYHCAQVILVYPRSVDMERDLYVPFTVVESNETIIAATINLLAFSGSAEARTRLTERFRVTITGEVDYE
jgi:5-methylcytosine-specific restriction enzyme subunit McrC